MTPENTMGIAALAEKAFDSAIADIFDEIEMPENDLEYEAAEELVFRGIKQALKEMGL